MTQKPQIMRLTTHDCFDESLCHYGRVSVVLTILLTVLTSEIPCCVFVLPSSVCIAYSFYLLTCFICAHTLSVLFYGELCNCTITPLSPSTNYQDFLFGFSHFSRFLLYAISAALVCMGKPAATTRDVHTTYCANHHIESIIRCG